MVTRKSDWLEIYKETIDDEWTPLLNDVYVKCKEAWSYHIPESEAERHHLRQICAQTLAFENHYLTRYRTFLLTELRSPLGARQRFALERIGQVIYPDDEVQTALEAVELDS